MTNACCGNWVEGARKLHRRGSGACRKHRVAPKRPQIWRLSGIVKPGAVTGSLGVPGVLTADCQALVATNALLSARLVASLVLRWCCVAVAPAKQHHNCRPLLAARRILRPLQTSCAASHSVFCDLKHHTSNLKPHSSSPHLHLSSLSSLSSSLLTLGLGLGFWLKLLPLFPTSASILSLPPSPPMDCIL